MNYSLTRDVWLRFKDYERKHPEWGSLHIVLSDLNLRDIHVEFCIKNATENGDSEGVFLAEELLKMTKTQRGKLARSKYVFAVHPSGRQ